MASTTTVALNLWLADGPGNFGQNRWTTNTKETHSTFVRQERVVIVDGAVQHLVARLCGPIARQGIAHGPRPFTRILPMRLQSAIAGIGFFEYCLGSGVLIPFRMCFTQSFWGQTNIASAVLSVC
jgi:hypothetical protein